MMCLSPAALILFLQMTGLPFDGVPEGVLVHASDGPRLYVLVAGVIYCTGGDPV